MLHKEFKRARREWGRIADEEDASILAQWALDYAQPLLDEVKRLREELKARNRKKRKVHARLAAEEDDHDALLDDIESFKAWMRDFDIVSQDVIIKRLDEILAPYKDEDR